MLPLPESTLFPYTTLFRSLLNGVSFDIIGVVAKVGREGNNGTNARIETMRMLFPLKAENAEDALSFINYQPIIDRKSTRLNSSHTVISYAVFCLKKKKINE